MKMALKVTLILFRLQLSPFGFLPWLMGQKEEEEEVEEGHLTGRCCSPSTVFFRGKGQRIQYDGTPAEGNH